MKIVIKYANRKLYDKEEHKYISIKELVKLPLDSFIVVRHGLTAEDVTLDTLLSALTTDGIETESKILVMQHCLIKMGATKPKATVVTVQTLNSGIRLNEVGAGPLPEILEEDDLFN